jgi:zinc transporter, ZIP family
MNSMDQSFLIVAFAVFTPILGSFIGVLKRPSMRFLFNMLSFAAGVMLAISFLNLIPESIVLSSILTCAIGVLAGSFFMYLLDKAIPHIHPELMSQEPGCNLKKTSIYLIMGIFLHNFPEGMAMAIGTVTDTKLAFAIALGIAIHNIPEGICTSAPYYYCNKKRLKSFLISSMTAIPVLLGYVFGYFLYSLIPSSVVGLLIAMTAGIMIYISADELIPTSKWKDHSTIFSLIAGVLLVILLGML